MRGAASIVMAVCTLCPGIVRAEVIEEIVAKIDDDIITTSEMDQREQEMTAELYKRYTGAALDEELAKTRAFLLRRMIDEKILLHRASSRFDLEKAGDSFVDAFKQQQKLNDEELRKALEKEGLTLADLRKQLVTMWIPGEVIRFEVQDRVSVGDKEVAAYHAAHVAEFTVPAEATVREIVLLAQGAATDRREEAERLRERAAAPGADFAAIASEVSEAGTKATGGLLGPVRKGDLAAPIDELAFSLPPGQVGPVVAMPHGFNIVKVEARVEARVRPLAEVSQEIRRKLEGERYDALLKEFLKKSWSESTIEIMPKYQDKLAPLD
jgi:parvulin-like peptidyl-prolyl isomerase